jgi:GNAT superfamily N-acetyltransferase
MRFDVTLERLQTPALELQYHAVPWDTEILGFPVGQIAVIRVSDARQAARDFEAFERWRDAAGIRLVSCRLDSASLPESMFLEGRGFKFIELVNRPELRNVQACAFPPGPVEVLPATAADLPEIEKIAATAFGVERFHVDPRLGPEIGNRRYRTWVRNSATHATQRILKGMVGNELAAFFVVEEQPQPVRTSYWHLTAVATRFQGRGVGRAMWQAVIMRNKSEGAELIRTTIAARNTAVMNLYVSLGFRFATPLMTLHWVGS